jgi:formate dehydrogenase maturation protein FdhE
MHEYLHDFYNIFLSQKEIRKKFMSILNKISPENMTQLAESITTLPLDTDEQLKTVIDLLFQKVFRKFKI